MDLTVIVPTHNPNLRRLRATLAGLRNQTLPAERWETVVIDNASASFPAERDYADVCPRGLRVLPESRLGLTWARLRGFGAATAPVVVLVDDDNVLTPDYLASVLAIFAAHPRVGLIGGKSLPEFESEPPAWAREFSPLLALRDLGESDLISSGLRPAGAACDQYPACAPIGAGMAARMAALAPWLEFRASGRAALSDRHGTELSSSGDNDIVLCALRAGWEVGYFPRLRLTHLIPDARLDANYLARLNRGIQRSWMQVLRQHDANPWPAITRVGAWLRQCRAWFTYRAWRGPSEHIRWQGARGHFDGRVG